MDMEEPHMWLYADLYVQIFDCVEGQHPNHPVVQG